MIYRPRPYQRLITAHELGHRRQGVWASMGMGKTAATLAAIDARQLVNARPELVLAPLRVARSTWPDEVRKWDNLSHIEVQPILGDRAERVNALQNRNAAVFTINYDNLPWLVEHLGSRWPFGHITADESTRLKSFRLGGKKGRRARSLIGIMPHTKDGWTNLTGTPSPNGLIDLWGQTWFLDAGARLGKTFTAFQDRWFRTKPTGFGKEHMPGAEEVIQKLLRDLHLTIDARDWFDIADPIVTPVYVELPAGARFLYRRMEKEMFMQLGGHDIEAVNAASRTIKCLQLANGAAYLDDTGAFKEVHDEKLQALESIIEEAAGAPVLVAYHFKSDLARLRHAFPYGRVLDADPATIREWNSGAIQLLFAHPAAAGHGINLQDGGNILVFFGHWWALEEYQQIIERIGPVRQKMAGHDRPVLIYHIIARGTVDELVMLRRETKRSVQDILLAAMKAAS